MPSYSADDLAKVFIGHVRQKGAENGLVPVEQTVTDSGVTVTFQVMGDNGDTGERVNITASRSDLEEQVKHPLRFDEFLARACTPAFDAMRAIRAEAKAE